MAQNYFTLDKIIRELLLKSGESSEHKYALYHAHACSFLDEFVSDTAREVRTYRLAMGTDRAIVLPPDFIDWVKVGALNGDAVRPMYYNTSMSKLAPEQPVSSPMLNYIDATGNHCGELNITGYYFPNASFNVDYSRKIMRFSSQTDVGDIYLEYLSNAIDVCSDTPVHPYAKSALERYIKWQEQLNKGRLSDARELERLYYNERRKLTGRMNPFSLESMHDIINRNYSPNVR